MTKKENIGTVYVDSLEGVRQSLLDNGIDDGEWVKFFRQNHHKLLIIMDALISKNIRNGHTSSLSKEQSVFFGRDVLAKFINDLLLEEEAERRYRDEVASKGIVTEIV